MRVYIYDEVFSKINSKKDEMQYINLTSSKERCKAYICVSLYMEVTGQLPLKSDISGFKS